MAVLESPDTPTRILRAAFQRLLEDGYARLSTRDIAAQAGVNHALIHYYFGTKDKLVIAALDEANNQLLERQTRMYESAGGFPEKWARAREFYAQDLASGFVRVQMELWAASLSNPTLRQEFVPRVSAWRRVIQSAVREALDRYQLHLPVSADIIACWISDFWIGMEFEMLLGISEEEAHHQEAMDAMQSLLEQLEAQAPARASNAKDGKADQPAAEGERDGRSDEHLTED